MRYCAIVFCGLFVVACSTKNSTGAPERRVLARVNGVPIYLDTLKREMLRQKLDGNTTSSSSALQRKLILQNLIDRRLLLEQAEAHNVLVGIDEVESTYQSLRSSWQGQEHELDELFKQKDITSAELKHEIRELLQIKKYLRDHVYSRIAVTDTQISDYIEEHPEVLVAPEQVRALHIVVGTENKANQIRNEIKKGLAFEDAAMKYSSSPDARTGGDLGLFSRGSMPGVFDDVCFELREGEISEVVPSDYGYHLFKVVEKRKARALPALEARDEVERILRRAKEREAHAAKVAELRERAEIEIKAKELASAN